MLALRKPSLNKVMNKIKTGAKNTLFVTRVYEMHFIYSINIKIFLRLIPNGVFKGIILLIPGSTHFPALNY